MAQDTAALRRLLSESGLSPNRALGQNFCTNGALLAEAVSRANFTGKNVLEIGPGLGALTTPLLAVAARVVAVEKDAAMAKLLPTLLTDDRLTVVHGDILRADPAALFSGAPFSVAGNLPYYITSPILERFLPLLPETLLLMVQQEAAARFFAQPGDRVYGPMAVLSQVYYAPETLFFVPRSDYYPQPDVDSCVVLLTRRKAVAAASVKDGESAAAETAAPETAAAPAPLPAAGALFSFLRRAFAMRRKTLSNNFARDAALLSALEALGVPENVRAEALPPETLAALAALYNQAADVLY